MNRSLKLLFIGMPTLIMAGLILAILAAKLTMEASLGNQSSITIEITKSDNLHRVLRQLDEQGIIEPYQRKLLLIVAKVMDKGQIIKGQYELPQQINLLQLLAILNEGKVKQHYVTLVEGTTFKQAIERLSLKLSQQTQSQQQNEQVKPDQWSLDITQVAGIDNNENYEGLLYPDTYAYQQSDTVDSIVQRAFTRLVKILNEEWQQRQAGLPYNSPYEALIMASIIEKETGVAIERPEIAGVFVRRLLKGMKLQTDPTVIYGLGEDYQGNLKRKHLRTANPYNTYMIKDLPPTPIALAGRAAIHAALNPKQGKTLYFVAKGDGSHYFSKTLAEHEQAVRRYQIEKRRQDYRSAPK